MKLSQAQSAAISFALAIGAAACHQTSVPLSDGNGAQPAARDPASRAIDMANSPFPDLVMAENPDLAFTPMPLPAPSPLPNPVNNSPVDAFGVREIYPTAPGGREWLLPDDATHNSEEWQPNAAVTQVAPGVFHVTGAPRMHVVSPTGKAWWKNVEVTGYLKQTATNDFYPDQVPHFTFFARSERHGTDMLPVAIINGGVRAPQGTAVWPGYPFDGWLAVNNACLSTSYEGCLYPDGRVLTQKEISHTDGYNATPRGQTYVPKFASPMNRWVGLKMIIRNESADSRVKLEMWMDENGNGDWTKVTESHDDGTWAAQTSSLNGCTAAPFHYSQTEVLTWAGPFVTFRVDDMDVDFKSLSVREVAALP